MPELSLRQKYQARKSDLWRERSTWMPHWQDISRYILPRNGRFLAGDPNRGEKRHNNIYDSTATRALRVLAAGLMAGMTSPARPWFRLATGDKKLMEYAPVKEWLNDVTELMRYVFQRSNTYRALHMLYEELGGFGTGASIILPDYEDVVRHYPLTIGEYAIGTNSRGEVDTLYREMDITVSNAVMQFGADNVSVTVKNMFDRGQLDSWVPVVHVVEPRAVRDYRSKMAKDMAFASCYYEVGNSNDKMLRESGFKRFNALVPRWAATGGDIYGNSPGMEALGDVKQLQHQQLRKGQGIDYMVKPNLQMPASMKGNEHNAMPGGVSYYDGANKIETSWEVRLDLQHLLGDIMDVRTRINETFYKNLFMMLADDQRSGVTAREVAEKHEEKLLMIGPVLERLHNELLKRKIDVTFDEMIEAGIVPPAPPEMNGQELNVEFISMLAQAQRAIGTGSVDRYVGAMGVIAQMKPGVLDKFNEDEWADKYSDMLGIDPTMIVADDKVAIIRKERAAAQAAVQQQAQQAQAAQTAQVMSNTPTGGETALSDTISNYSGYGGPGLPTAV